MRSFRQPLIVLLLLALLAGCATPLLPSTGGQTPPEVASLGDGLQKIAQAAGISQAPARVTPTPFRPLPPTPVFFPTSTPLPAPTATPVPPTPTPTINPADLAIGIQAQSVSQPGSQINILILGADKRPGWKQWRTDVVILATLNTELGTVNLTSFPRDLWVTIPGGYGEDRINTVWSRGGFELLAETFDYNFGVTPEHFVLVKFNSFKRIIDSLGGLDVQVHQALNDYRSGYPITIDKGMNHMDADLALWYVRSRKTTNDFQRGKRQQEVIMAIFDKAFSLNAMRRIPEFYGIYRENVITDIDITHIVPLLPLAAKITDQSHINHYFIGPEQAYDWITPGGAMVLVPRPDAVKAVMRKALNVKGKD